MISDSIRNHKISPRQEAVALLLAAGESIEDAARKSRCVAAPTIRGWLAQQPAFKKRIGQLRSELTERTLGLLADASAQAVLTLWDLCTRGKSESTKLKAADSILAHAVKVREAVELSDRITSIEESL